MSASRNYGQQVGDGIVQKIEIDFKAKKTTVLLERWQDANAEEPERISLLFTGVELQDFIGFNTFNLFTDMDEAADAMEFWRWWHEWLDRNKNYLGSGLLASISVDTSLRYFSIMAGSGFDGFIYLQRFSASY